MKVYAVWCEWDIGLNDLAFISKEAAERSAKNALIDCGIEGSIDELYNESLLGYTEMEVVE